MPTRTRSAVELAKVGRWNASTGEWNCTRTQLADAARAASSGKFRNPVLIRRGHTDPRFDGDKHISADGEPALGQVKNVRLSDDGNSLLGDLLVPEWLDDELDAIYPSRSVEADLGVETSDGDTFGMVMTGLALLGVTKPAIQPLADLPERIAASDYTAAFSIAASWDESAHPRGGKGSAAGGKFISKGAGYKGKEEDASDVQDVQTELIRLGLLSKDSGQNGGVDGLFGPRTEEAVKKWQTAHGHEATGKVTRALLKTLQSAKKDDATQARKLADHPHKTSKTHPAKPTVKHHPVKHHANPHGNSPKARVPFNARIAERVKAAADQVAETHDLDTVDVTDTGVIWTDGDGFPWIAGWEAWTADDSIRLSAPEPAHAVYERVTDIADQNAATLSVGLGSATAASLGASSVDTAQSLREALGLDDAADENAVMTAALERLSQSTETPPAPTLETVAPAEPVIPAAPELRNQSEPQPQTADIDTLVAAKVAAALAPIVAGQSAYERQIADLSGQLAARNQREATDHKTQVLAAAREAGKFTPAEAQMWSDEWDKAPQVVERILASTKPNTAVPVMASGYAGSADVAITDADEALYRSWFPEEAGSNG